MISVTNMTMQVINDNPDGIKICRISGKTLVTIIIPRRLLADAAQLPEIPSRGIYYLLDNAHGHLKRVYAGQTVQGIRRLDSHNSRKDWWSTAVMFLAPNSEFSMDIVSGLEYAAIKYIHEHGSYEVDNANEPKPYMSPYDEQFINELHEDILFRMALLGFDLDGRANDNEPLPTGVFHTLRRGVNARGMYRPDEKEFEVLPGSQVDISTVPGTNKQPDEKLVKLRQSLVKNRELIQEPDGAWRLKKSVRLKSPSAAGRFVLGGSINGREEWFDEDGRTFSEVYPKGGSR